MPNLRPSSQHIDLTTAEGKKLYQREIEGSSDKLSLTPRSPWKLSIYLRRKVKKMGLTTEIGNFGIEVAMDA